MIPMFDLSWVELVFCATLAIVFIGPKDLPRFMAMLAELLRKARRLYGSFQAGARKLEQEVHSVEAGVDAAGTQWERFLPAELSGLPDDYQPGQFSAQEYEALKAERRAQIKSAQEKARVVESVVEEAQ